MMWIYLIIYKKLSEMMVDFPILGLRFDRFDERSNVLLNQADMQGLIIYVYVSNMKFEFVFDIIQLNISKW